MNSLFFFFLFFYFFNFFLSFSLTLRESTATPEPWGAMYTSLLPALVYGWRCQGASWAFGDGEGALANTVPIGARSSSNRECASAVSRENWCHSYFWSKESGESIREGENINISPWGEKLIIPLCLLICKLCQRLLILSEQRKEETDAEIITILAKNFFLYPEGELWPHSCL